jgi:hypothetical protein
MDMSPVGLGTKNHCAGEGQQQFSRQADTISYDGMMTDELGMIRGEVVIKPLS